MNSAEEQAYESYCNYCRKVSKTEPMSFSAWSRLLRGWVTTVIADPNRIPKVSR